MYPLVDVVTLQVVVDQVMCFEQLATQVTADRQGRIGMGFVLGVFHHDGQLADVIEILFGKRAVQQVEAQHAIAVCGQLVGLFASLDHHRAFGPGQA